MTYGEVLRLTEGHGTSELWERWQEMTARLAAAEERAATLYLRANDAWASEAAARRALEEARAALEHVRRSTHGFRPEACDGCDDLEKALARLAPPSLTPKESK